MKTMWLVALPAMVLLVGCEGTADWLRGSPAATADAAPLASDTTVVTVRRVWAPSWASGASIMPDGAGLATPDWDTGDPGILDLASGEIRRFPLNDEPFEKGLAMTTVASPDGGRIAFSWEQWVEPGPAGQLRILEVATGESRVVLAPPDTSIAGHPVPVMVMPAPKAWTLEGDSVFATLYPQGGRGRKVVLVPAEGGTARLVHTIGSSARPGRMSLSPDGRWLLYDHGMSGDHHIRSDIHVIDVQGGGARPLIEHPGLDLLVGWIPGTDIVLFSSDRSGTTDLWSVRVAGGRASAEPRLVRSGFHRSHAVGFGGGALFYTVQTGSRGPSVINMDPESGAPVGLRSPPLPDLGNARAWTFEWSPDGQSLAWSSTVRESHIVTLHSLGSGESRVFWLGEEIPTVWAIDWAADGTALFLRVGESRSTTAAAHHFLRLDLVSGTTTRLSAEADGTGLPSFLQFRTTPDGRSMVLRERHTLDEDRTEMTLVLRSLEGGGDRELYRTAHYLAEFSLSADGTQLAFVQQAGENSDSLFVMQLDGSRPLRAIAIWEHDWDDAVSLLGWLPGAGALLVTRLTADRETEEIHRIGLDGSTGVVGVSPFKPRSPTVRSVRGLDRSWLVLSPAGNRIVDLVSDVSEELWRMDGLHELFAEDGAGRR